MAKRNNIEKIQRIRTVLYMIAVVMVAMVIEILILRSLINKNAGRSSSILLDHVCNAIEQNQKNEKELMDTLKDAYMIRAQAVAYMLDANPEIEDDVQELKKIAELMQIDEIHLFDETGVIYGGTNPEYYGYSFSSGSQMSYFKPMLYDRSRKMCQDITPNTASGEDMMYAITWNESRDKMVQVGITPERLQKELRSEEISELVAEIPAYDVLDVFVTDAASGEICGSTNDGFIGSTLESIGIQTTDADMSKPATSTFQIDGEWYYCRYRTTGDYIVFVTYSKKSSIQNYIVSLAIEFLYLLLAGIIIVYTMNRLVRANHEKNIQMATLASMSDIYNSMHLIDLENNTIKEYNARKEISKVVSNTYGADESMKNIRDLTVEKEYYDDAAEFMDLHTMAERMQNKKIISEEFMSKAIGWYRASFIAIEADEEGYPTKVLYVTQNIDKQKRKEEELIIKSNTDGLTGFYNRMAYEEMVQAHHDIVMDEDFVYVSFDVNGLKPVNDNLGHAAGDELLIGAAACIKQCFGPYGRLYRIGGDEFIAIIFADELQLQRIKKDFDGVMKSWSGKHVKSLSISCGYVTKRETDANSIHMIAKIADKRMYEAKDEYYRITGLQRRMGNA